MRYYICSSAAAMLIGFIADLIFGDPITPLHPVCLIGDLIFRLEKILRSIFPETQKGELRAGLVMVITVVLISAAVPAGILFLAYHIHFLVGIAAESVMCFFIFSVKSLKKESMNVAYALENEGLISARKAVSRIVGRDTGSLSVRGVIKAAVETVAENFSDGILAPMLYMAVGGGILGFTYKSINTMDSMLGYKNDRYLYFGRCAAVLDDIVNFIPSRLAALALIISAFFAHLDMKNSFRIWKRDRRRHFSPNAAQTESAAAGALHIQLAGDAYYFGKLYKKPFIGDDDRPPAIKDIERVNRLVRTASVLSIAVCTAVKLFILLVSYFLTSAS